MTAMRSFEFALLDWIQGNLRNPVMDLLMPAVTTLGNGGLIWIALAGILLLIPRYRKAGAAVLAGLALEVICCNLVLKPLIARVRPCDVNTAVQLLVARPDDFSFPSGHTCVSFAASLVYLRMLPRPWGAASVVLAAVIALSRLYVGVHYPSDVLGGFLVGCLVSWAAVRLAERRKTGQIVRDQ